MVRNVKERLNWKNYSWQKFEDICFEYMEEKYDSPAYRVEITKRQKDGGRDIVVVGQESDYIIWGECKHHKSSIGLSAIGKNVVLAITNHIHKIVFFSVSHVTPNTKYEILRAAKIHNFDVSFLDGTSLDLEISGSKRLLRKYFSESYHLYNPNKDILLADFCVDEFPNAHNSEYNLDNSYTRLENSLFFYIHIFLKNYFSQDVMNVSISVKESEGCHFHQPYIEIEQIKSSCDTEITLKALLLDTQHPAPIPNIEIKYVTGGLTRKLGIVPGEIDGTHIWRIPFCGARNLNFLVSDIQEIERAMKKGYARILYLKGVSGTGKTRMLEEIESKLAEKNIVPIYIDIQSYAKNLFFCELIRQMLCLPVGDQKDIFDIKDFEGLLKKYQIAFPCIQLLYDFLWQGGKEELSHLVDFVYQCIIYSPIKQQIFLQIDNIQKMDANVQFCMTYLCDRLKKEKIAICIAFALNTSEECVSKNSPLISFLNNNSIHEEDPFVTLLELQKLEESHAHEMIQSFLKLSASYASETQRIAQKTGRLPLDILLFCKTLSNSGCFSWDGKNFIISNAEKFNQQLNLLSLSEFSIIKMRIEKIISNCSKQRYLKLFQLIVICENQLPVCALSRFKISLDFIRKLKENLILKENYNNNTISFYHGNYLRYFKQQGTLYVLTKKDWQLLHHVMENTKIQLGAIAQINQAKCLCFLKKKEEFIQYSELLLDELCNQGNGQAILALTQFCLDKMSEYKYRNQWLRFATEMGFVEMEITSFAQGIATLKKIKEKLDSNNLDLNKKLIGKFYYKYVNSYMHSCQYYQALRALEDYSRITDLPDKDYFLIEDRYCVASYSLGDFDEAEIHIEKALSMAYAMNNDFWVSTAYSDRAFNYLTNTNQVDKIIEYFNLAVEYYPRETDKTQHRLIEIEIQSCISNILSKNYAKAREHIDSAIQCSKERDYLYLQIPAYNVKAYLMLLQGDMDEALRILFQARFDSEVFGDKKFLAIIFNTLGVAYCLDEKWEEGANYFRQAEEMLRELGKPEYVANRFAPLIRNWMYREFSFSPDEFKKNKKYNSYHTKDLDSFYQQLCTEEDTNVTFSQSYPFVINNCFFMY